MNVIDQNKLNEFMGKFAEELGVALHAPTIILGEKLGLDKAMSEAQKELSPTERGSRTGTKERSVAEWLAAHAAYGYVKYDATQKKILADRPSRSATTLDRER